MYSIYTITNITNGKQYVGSTKQYDVRVRQHKNQLRLNSHHNVMLQRAYNKDSNIDKFIFEEIFVCLDSADHFDLEKLFILQLKPSYNIGSVGGGDNLTLNPNREDIIERMTLSVRARYDSMSEEEKKLKHGKPGDLNPNWKGGVSKAYCQCGNEMSLAAKTCHACRDRTAENNPFYGKSHSEESKQKMREAIEKKKVEGTWKLPANCRRVSAEGMEFESLTACSRHFGVVLGTISNRLKSKNYPTYFYINA